MSDKSFTDWKPYLVPKKYKDNYDRIFKKHKYVVGNAVQLGISKVELLNAVKIFSNKESEINKCLKN